MTSQYPEHDKLAAIRDDSQAIGEFLDSCGYELCQWRPTSTVPPYIDSRTGTPLTPRGRPVSANNDYVQENPEWYPEGYYPVSGGIPKILAKHFGIDLEAIEREKRQMLDSIRAA